MSERIARFGFAQGCQPIAWTPEVQFNDDAKLRRDLLILHMHDIEGLTLTAIAKSLRRSNSRIAQIYHRAKKARRNGVL